MQVIAVFKEKLNKRRKELEMRRFPSQDIWEDTPNSLQLQTTVDTPEQEDTKADASSHSTAAALIDRGDSTHPPQILPTLVVMLDLYPGSSSSGLCPPHCFNRTRGMA